jgi:hypothetical protein
VPVLLRLNGTVSGAVYRVDIHYAYCMGRYASSFDLLGPLTGGGDAPWLTAPAAGRDRPDSMTGSPRGHDGGHTVSLYAWGATFSAEARGAGAADTCDAVVTLELIARANTVTLGFGGHLRPNNAGGASGFAPLAVFVARAP